MEGAHGLVLNRDYYIAKGRELKKSREQVVAEVIGSKGSSVETLKARESFMKKPEAIQKHLICVCEWAESKKH